MDNNQPINAVMAKQSLFMLEFLESTEAHGHYSENYGSSFDCLRTNKSDRPSVIAGDFTASACYFSRKKPPGKPEYYWKAAPTRPFEPGIYIESAGKKHIVPDLAFEQFRTAVRDTRLSENGCVYVDLASIQRANQVDPEFTHIPVTQEQCGNYVMLTLPSVP